MSRIITFYSYKGGVGRTLALANIGVLLAKQGKRVLLMDWDLEAPGLDRYFRSYVTEHSSATNGIAHLLREATVEPKVDWRPHVQQITVKGENVNTDIPCTLSMIPSGVASGDYSAKVRSFSWARFMEEQEGGMILDRWREEWKNDFDFILIDSRTGITDAGGICTVLLPDLLVLVFTANDQSFEGAIAVSQSAQKERQNLAVQRPRLAVLPLLSRFDGRTEIDLAENWLKRFDSELQPFYDDWLPTRFQPRQILELTKVPYVTRFSFGEPLPVVTHSLTDPELPGFYFENVTRLLVSDFQDAALIIDPEAAKVPDIKIQILTLAQQTPLDQINLTRLLRTAEENFGQSDELSSLLNEAGTALRERARFELAEPLLRRALAVDEMNHGPNHPLVALRLNNLAQLLQDTSRLVEAELLLRRALEIGEQTLGPQHPKVATRLNNLATLLHETNRLREAEPLLRRALAIDEQTLGSEHPAIAIRLNNLAQLLMDTNRYEEAERLIRRALTIEEHHYGSEHPEVASTLTNLAALLTDRDRMTEGESLIRRALAIDEAHYGSDHPAVANDLNTLATCLYEMRNFREAEPLIRRSLAINERSFGTTHAAVANNLNNLASLLARTGRSEEAEPLIRRALQIEEQNYGSEHPNVAIRLGNLAGLLKNTNRVGEAEPLARQGLNILVKFTITTGHQHANLQTALNNYATILRVMGRADEEIKTILDSIGMGLPLSKNLLQND